MNATRLILKIVMLRMPLPDILTSRHDRRNRLSKPEAKAYAFFDSETASLLSIRSSRSQDQRPCDF